MRDTQTLERRMTMYQDRFHYCLPMERVEWELLDERKCPSGMASAFANPTYLKRRCRTFLQKIKKRVNNVVTTDESLRLLLAKDVDHLDEEFRRLSRKNNNDVEIFAGFFILIVHLLGWAHIDGTFYRTPIYHQTEEQRQKDIQKVIQSKARPGFLPECYAEIYKRKQRVVQQLLSEGASYYEVALIMGITVSNVKTFEKGESRSG